MRVMKRKKFLVVSLCMFIFLYNVIDHLRRIKISILVDDSQGAIRLMIQQYIST